MLKAVEAPLCGHPDKVCDVLVEAVVDEYLRRDPKARLDIQALGANGMIVLGGMADSVADFDVAAVARSAYALVGYDDEPAFFVNVERSGASRVNESDRPMGTAIVSGFACNETREMLPLPAVYSRALARTIDDLRENDSHGAWLCPDGKVQLVMDGLKVTSLLILAEHKEGVDINSIRNYLFEKAITPVFKESVEGAQVLINPSGAFVRGGFAMNAGVSGRKISNELYGGLLPHSGSSFIGKDPYKPARSGSLLCRQVAKNLVGEGLSEAIFVQAIYAVGVEEPVAICATSKEGDDLSEVVKKRWDFRPTAIVERFSLDQPRYAECALHGSLGRPELPWEK